METKRDTVVLLHGLGRTRWSMKLLEHRLAARGYRVVNLGYASTRQPIEKLAADVGAKLQGVERTAGQRLHFVTHSLGGIVLRAYLREHECDGLGRVVMLGPPNQGSEVADWLRGNLLYKFFTGPAGQQLGTGPDSVPNTLGPVDFELGVITGNRSPIPFVSKKFSGENDGKVSARRAQVEGMSGFLVVPRGHTFIMNSRRVTAQVAHFLEHGRFAPAPGPRNT